MGTSSKPRKWAEQSPTFRPTLNGLELAAAERYKWSSVTHLPTLCFDSKSVVRPHVEYCTSAWSPHYVKVKELIERIQRRFTRTIPGIRDLGLPYDKRLQQLTGSLWTLEGRLVRADLIEVFKILIGQLM